MDRRTFLQWMGVSAALGFHSCSPLFKQRDRLGAVLPLRKLGSTGEKVTCLGLGGFHIGWTSERLARETIEAALEEGVRFFDTAESYGPHTSELRYGQYLTPGYRDLIFLMSKSTASTSALAREHLEGSLRRMKTEVIDLWQIHSLGSPEDVDKRMEQGVLDVALKAREEGKIRYIGFTGHASPYAQQRILEKTKDRPEIFAACQFPVNPVDAASSHSFLELVLPRAKERNMGILAMKTLADGRFFAVKDVNEKTIWTSENPVIPRVLSVEDCIHFALSLPVSVLITGAEKPEYLREKAAMVRSFQDRSPEQRLHLAEKVADYAASGSVEYYKAKECRG